MSGALLLGSIAGALSFVGYAWYIAAIVWGKTRPSRATWWILTLVGVLISMSYYAEGARSTIWIAVSHAVGPGLIAILSLKWGEGGWGRLDKICFAGAALSIGAWFVFESAMVVLLLNILMDAFALVPTLRKSYTDPESESAVAWFIEVAAGLLAIVAIEEWTFQIAVYPVYLFSLNLVILMLLCRRYG